MKHVSKTTATNERRNMRKEFAPAASVETAPHQEEASTACVSPTLIEPRQHINYF